MRDEGRPPEHEIPAQRAQELAPEHMVEIFVDCRTDTSFGARLPISGVGRAMLDGQVDFGPGLRQIRIELHQAAGAPTHPRIRLQQAKGVLSIVFPSALSEDKFTDRDAYTELFREGIDAVLEALEAARERVTDEMPEFDFDALVERCRSIRDRVPETADELDALIENADVKARTLRVAMSRLGRLRSPCARSPSPRRASTSRSSPSSSNSVMYTFLHRLSGTATRAGFLHIPDSPQHVAALGTSSPSMDLSLVEKAVRAALAAIIANPRADLDLPANEWEW